MSARKRWGRSRVSSQQFEHPLDRTKRRRLIGQLADGHAVAGDDEAPRSSSRMISPLSLRARAGDLAHGIIVARVLRSVAVLHAAALQIATKSPGSSEAPPTRPPSTSASANSSAALAGFTEPP